MKSYYLKITSLILLFFAISINKGYSQQKHKTAYERRIEKITEKYFSITYFGYNRPLTLSEKSELQMITNEESARKFVLGLGILNYARNHSEAETKRLVRNFKKELESAKRLKTSIDYKREKERKAQLAKKEFEKTDKGIILKIIIKKFYTWSEKGEFEKQADYEERLKSDSKNKFDEICVKEIKNQINSYYYDTYYSSDDNKLKKILGTYNADNEYFPVTFKLNKKEWYNNIKIPLNEAKTFKEKWDDLHLKKDYYNWCFVDNYLYPTIINLYSNDKKYNFFLTLGNQSDIKFPFKDLNINNPYLKEYVFSFSKAKELARKKFIQDSLKYKKQIDKYNSLLLKNPYNIKKEEFSEVSLLKKNENIAEKLKLLKKKFNEKSNEIEVKLKNNYPKKYCEIFFSNHPDKKIEADKKFLDCKCKLNRDDFNIKFINNNLSPRQCKCRRIQFGRNGYLFKNKDEFNSFYNQGDSIFINEIEKRKAISFIKNHASEIYEINIKKKKKESLGSSLLNNYQITQQKDYQSINKTRKELLKIITDSKDKMYYSTLINLLIDKNKKLNKEWIKKGKYFKNKTDFFNTYLLSDYKKKLKEKKKKFKKKKNK